MKLKLTKKMIDGDRLILSESYLSNGHWAIARSLLDPRLNNAAALGTLVDTVKEDMTDAQIERSIKLATKADRTWTVTGWLYESGRQLSRIAVAEDGTRAYFTETYCAALGIVAGSILLAESADAPAKLAGDDLIVLMPRRAEDGIDLPAMPAPKTAKSAAA